MNIYQKQRNYPYERVWGSTEVSSEIRFDGKSFDNDVEGHVKHYSKEHPDLFIKDYSSYKLYPIYGLYDGDYEERYGSEEEMKELLKQYPHLEMRKTDRVYHRKKIINK